MWYKRRKMAVNQQNQHHHRQNRRQHKHENDEDGKSSPTASDDSSNVRDLSHQLCFVHQIADLPLVSASLGQIFDIYEKVKKSNRILGASLHLAENGTKYAAKKVEPIRRLLDSPIVAANKFGCNQLEKLKGKFPVIQITPSELYNHGKVYYDDSYVKGAVDKAHAIVNYGQTQIVQNAINKYNNSIVKSGVDTVHSIVTYAPQKLINTSKICYNSYFKPGVEQAYTIVAYLPQQPDMAILVLTQNAFSTVANLTDFVNKRVLETFMPNILHKNVVVVVQYVHDLSESFNKRHCCERQKTLAFEFMINKLMDSDEICSMRSHLC
uniref:Uncharacterized protein n=1 Tax=Romanomermis culicivorax TaxID=13658 RepID=A0A915JA72_ROMCU